MSDPKSLNNPSGRRLVAIMFTDIVGYTVLIGQNEQKALDLLKESREFQKLHIEKWGGIWLKEMGDGVLASFSSALHALQCAIEIQQKTQNGNLESKIRIGIHIGDVNTNDQDVFGEGVNIASRLQSIADPGGIYFSEDIQRLISSRTDIQLFDLGNFLLKNVKNPVHTFAIKGEGFPKPNRKKTQLFNTTKKIIRVLLPIIILFFSLFWAFEGFNIFRSTKIVSIAVLPFENLSGNINEEYFSDGMTETLITDLSKIKALTVVGRNSIMRYKNSNKLISEIANELNVDAIIKGSVIRENNLVRINVSLIEGKTDNNIWADRYDGDLTSILLLHSEVAQDIAKSIQVVITPEESSQLKDVGLVNPDAFEDFLLGRYHLYKLTPDDYKISLKYFESALNKDSDYALAWAGISMLWIHSGQWANILPKEAAKNAMKAAKKAIDIDSSLSETRLVWAMYNAAYAWDWEVSDVEFSKAISLNPNLPEPHLFYGDFLISLRREKEAFEHIYKAIEVDPLNAFSYSMLGWGFYATNEFDKAIVQLNKSLQTEKNLSLSLRCLWSIYHLNGEYEQAIIYAKRFYGSQGYPEISEMLENNYISEGYLNSLKLAADALANKADTTYIPGMRIARLYTFTNDNELALNWLEKAYNERFPSIFSLNVDPHWVSLYRESRFQKLLDKMNFPIPFNKLP